MANGSPPVGLPTTAASIGVGGAIAGIVAAHFPGMSPGEVADWGILLSAAVGLIAHSSLGGKFFPKSTSPVPPPSQT